MALLFCATGQPSDRTILLVDTYNYPQGLLEELMPWGSAWLLIVLHMRLHTSLCSSCEKEHTRVACWSCYPSIRAATQ